MEIVITAPEENTTSNLKALKPRESLVLKNLMFIPGRHWPQPQAYLELETLLNILKENQTLKIEIQGPVCCETKEKDGYDYDSGDNFLSRTGQNLFMVT